MATKQITIPITDHDDNCTQYYIVEYKLSSESTYTSYQAMTVPIVISNLLDAAEYNVRITRYCCNNSFSTPLTLLVDTTTDSPTLDETATFTLDPDGSGILTADWDLVTDAENYHVELSLNSNFATIIDVQDVADPADFINISGLTNGTLYYGRVRAEASGYNPSGYVTASGTPTP